MTAIFPEIFGYKADSLPTACVEEWLIGADFLTRSY